MFQCGRKTESMRSHHYLDYFKMMNKSALTLIFFLFINTFSYSQETKFTPPAMLGGNINTPCEESNPLLSADGTLYFVRTGSPENTGGELAGQDIWYARFVEGKWAAAANDLQGINNGDNNAVVGIAEKGTKLFLINSYSAHPRRNRAITWTQRQENAWTIPQELDLTIAMQGELYGFYVHPAEDVLLISIKGKESLGKEDLYVSLKEDGKWQSPQHLGAKINSEGFEISPFLSADKKTLYFASDRAGGFGNADIYKSERKDDTWTSWTEPENLGAPVNSEAFDAYFSVYEDKVFFASNREGGSSNIYTSFVEIPAEETVVAEKKEPAEEEESVEEPAKEKAKENETMSPPDAQEFTVYFSFDNAEFTEEIRNILKEMLSTTHPGKVTRINITGHADSQGPEVYNQVLSEQRAKAVADFLIANGFEAGKIQTSGVGEAQPVAPNDILIERKKNRRVEVRIYFE